MQVDNRKKLFRKKELLVIVPVLVLAVVVYLGMNFFSPSAKYALIEKNGEVFERVDMSRLTDETEIIVDGQIPVTIVVGKGYAYVKSSDCPDKTCVRTGRISKSGQAAVCLPAGVSVRLVGGSGFDGETY